MGGTKIFTEEKNGLFLFSVTAYQLLQQCSNKSCLFSCFYWPQKVGCLAFNTHNNPIVFFFLFFFSEKKQSNT